MSLAACFVRRLHVGRRWAILWMAPAMLLGSAGLAKAQAVRPRPLGSDLPVYRLPEDQSGIVGSRTLEDPTGPLGLRGALSLALVQSPELATFAWEIRAREARLLQAGRPPNPVVTTEVQDLGGSTGLTGAADPIQSQTTIELSQLVELGGKRAARQLLAALDRDLAAWDYETARIDVLTRVTSAFLDVLASQQAVALTQDTARVVEQVQQVVGLKVAAGVVSPIEQTKAEVALAAVRIESDRARRMLDADRRRLAALWGSTSPRFHSAVGDLTTLPPMPTFGALQDRLSQNPDVARWAVEIAARDAALAVERSKRVPDVSVSGGYRRYPEIDSNAFVIGVSVQLPLFDRNRGGIQEARHRLGKAREGQRAAELRATVMLAEAYRTLASAHDEVAALASNVLPGARSAFAAIGEGYRLGKFGYLEVLDAQRTLVSAGGQYLRALSDCHKAAAEVERLIGEPLTAMTPSPPTAGQE
jgi:cobalt-zinc-cadmium efflux system outer membrane protein